MSDRDYEKEYREHGGTERQKKRHAADSARKQVCFLGKSVDDVLWESCV